jgi:hypothetical protein
MTGLSEIYGGDPSLTNSTVRDKHKWIQFIAHDPAGCGKMTAEAVKTNALDGQSCYGSRGDPDSSNALWGLALFFIMTVLYEIVPKITEATYPEYKTRIKAGMYLLFFMPKNFIQSTLIKISPPPDTIYHSAVGNTVICGDGQVNAYDTFIGAFITAVFTSAYGLCKQGNFSETLWGWPVKVYSEKRIVYFLFFGFSLTMYAAMFSGIDNFLAFFFGINSFKPADPITKSWSTSAVNSIIAFSFFSCLMAPIRACIGSGD